MIGADIEASAKVSIDIVQPKIDADKGVLPQRNLVLEATAPQKAQVGDEVAVRIELTNKGTADTSKIVVRAYLGDGLEHPEGKDIQAPFDELLAGQSRSATLRLKAAKAGSHSCSIVAIANGEEKTSAKVSVEILQPKSDQGINPANVIAPKKDADKSVSARQNLVLKATAPQNAQIGEEVAVRIELINNGKTDTSKILLKAVFTDGLEHSEGNDIQASLGKIPAGESQAITLRLEAAKAGVHTCSIVAIADAEEKSSAKVSIDIAQPKLAPREITLPAIESGVPALSLAIVDDVDPVELGQEFVYTIKVVNTGSLDCTNIRITASVTEGLQPTQVSANLPHKMIGQTLIFEPFAKLTVKEELIVRVKAKGVTAGEHCLSVQVSCDQFKPPMTKKEKTTVFQFKKRE